MIPGSYDGTRGFFDGISIDELTLVCPRPAVEDFIFSFKKIVKTVLISLKILPLIATL